MLLVHAEIGASVAYEHVELLKTTLVQKQSNPLTSSELAFLVLSVYSFLAAAHHRFGPALYQLLDIILLDTHSVVYFLSYTLSYNAIAHCSNSSNLFLNFKSYKFSHKIRYGKSRL